jgi:hypothetical protein
MVEIIGLVWRCLNHYMAFCRKLYKLLVFFCEQMEATVFEALVVRSQNQLLRTTRQVSVVRNSQVTMQSGKNSTQSMTMMRKFHWQTWNLRTMTQKLIVSSNFECSTFTYPGNNPSCLVPNCFRIKVNEPLRRKLLYDIPRLAVRCQCANPLYNPF